MFGRYPPTLLTAVLVVAAQPAFAQDNLGLGATESASAFRLQTNRRLTFVCPANDGANATVYGMDPYTDDSAVCAAAIHAGVLQPGVSGAVTIVIGSGAESFPASDRNGVKTRSYAAWPYSYTFATDGALSPIAWTTAWNRIPPEFAAPISVACPSGGTTDPGVWGNDVYTSDSSICLAAVHAGVITLEGGGPVTVTRAPALGEYDGIERNRVVSRGYGAWTDAFSVTAATTAGADLESAAGGISRRLLLAGFTGTGMARPIETPAASISRTIRVNGFEGSGLARERPPPVVISRRITTPGWTGTGSAQPRR